MNNSSYLHDLRHSAAHLLAHALFHLYKGVKFTIGPVTTNGFFYDVECDHRFTEKDLPLIEEKMRELAQKDYPITGGQVPKDEARTLYADNRYKLELIEGIQGDTVGIYHQGDFFDLCKGGHVASLGQIRYFKLTALSGSYWRADRNNAPLQRISGVAFENQEEMDAYFTRIEEAKKADHRLLGTQLDLYSFHEYAPGCAFFHPKGTILYNLLIEFSRKMQKKEYIEIKTPLVNNQDLYKTSGHYDFYKENAFTLEVDEHPYWVRPMNCPSCMIYYDHKPRSYRELPLRISEYGTVHRYELSGVLHGLFRVRSFTQDDAHLFCTPDQVKDEVTNILLLARRMYEAFGFKNLSVALSTRPEKFMGSLDLWDIATTSLQGAIEQAGLSYEIQEGEGAFYGPKIDIHIKDRMDRLWQCGTVQLDFNQPERFNLTYITAEQERKRPVVIHRALYGSIERFLGILTEHCAGAFPLWIAPVQARILTVSSTQHEYAQKVYELLFPHLRLEYFPDDGTLQSQIKKAQQDKIPWMIILGKKEAEQNTLSLRLLDGQQEQGIEVQTLILRVKKAEPC